MSPAYRPIAISGPSKVLYERDPAVAPPWKVFSPQPAFGASVAGDALVGTPDGGIICWRGNAGSEWCHFSPGSPGTWAYKAAAGVTGANANAFAYAANAVYAVRGAKVDRFDGANWGALTDLPGAATNPHIVSTAPGELWVTDSGGLALYYSNDDGATWLNRFGEMATAIGLTVGFRYVVDADVSSGVLYLAWTSAFDAIGRIVRYDGVSWTLVGGAGAGSDVSINDLCAVRVEDDSAIWAFGRSGGNDRVSFWNGSWAVQYTDGATNNPLTTAKILVGVDANLVVAANVNPAPNVRHETTDGSTWGTPTWPDANLVTALGVYSAAGPPPFLKESSPEDAETGVLGNAPILLDFESEVDDIEPGYTLITIDGELAWFGPGGAPGVEGWTVEVTEVTPRRFVYVLRRDRPFEAGATVEVAYVVKTVFLETLDDSISFEVLPAAEEVEREVYFPHRIYLFLLQSLRDADQADGGRLVERICDGSYDVEWGALYARIYALLDLKDPERAPAEALDFLRWIVGLTSRYDDLVAGLSESELRTLIHLAVRFWKRRGTESGLEYALETTLRAQVYVENWFDLRCLLGEWELGWTGVGGADLWLTDRPEMTTSARPDSVSWDGSALRFDLTTLLENLELLGGAPGGTPRDVRVLALPSRTTESGTWTADVEGNLSAYVEGDMNQGGAPSTDPDDYRAGTDPSEYTSYVSVQGRDANRVLVEGLVAALRPANERYFVRYVTFLDRFRREVPWVVESGGAAFDYDAGEVELYDAGTESFVRTNVLADVTWTEPIVRADLRFESAAAAAWGELRFNLADGDNFLALRLSPTGTLGATFSLDAVVGGVRSTLGSYALPGFDPGVGYILHADVEGDRVQAFLDGNLLVEATGTFPASGRLGLAAEAGQRLNCTYVEVAEKPIDLVRIGPPVSSR